MTKPARVVLGMLASTAIALGGCSSKHGVLAPDAGSGGATSTGGAAGGGGATGSGGAATTSTGGNGGGGAAGSSWTVADFVGLNGFPDDDRAKLSAVGNVREYHDWQWTDGNDAAGYPGYPNNQYVYTLFDFDGFYKTLSQAGVTVMPCIQGSVGYIDDHAQPPVLAGADVSDPASYVAHAAMLYQFAARYGQTAVAPSKLKLAAGQTASTGLGYIHYFENGNETDANWIDGLAGAPLFSSDAIAAMSSADYDGHQGALGATFGIKAADPKAKLVLAGLSGTGPSDWVTNVTTYLGGIKSWAAAHRGGSFPADVINVHDYCFGPDPFGTAHPRPGLSPEDCGLADLLAQVAHYRDQNLPDKELWLTEFGYDTHPSSRLRAPAIGAASAEVVQGQWLVRSFLALMGSGIERAFMYISRDDCTGDDTACPNDSVQFATAGVLTQKGSETPKAAWYFLSTFRARLGAMRYLGKLDGGATGVSGARFYDGATGHGAYVLWSPTSTGATIPGYSLHLATGVTSATVVQLQSGSTTGVERAASVGQGAVTLMVDETPTIVLVQGQP
ncbi:MAG TPA: hypothetical protein VGP07_12960 [Polyangia bacterium]